MPTQTSQERELKLRLEGLTHYEHVRLVLGVPISTIWQRNTYFDTPDRLLRKLKMTMVRVRETDDRVELTIKDRGQSSGDEQTVRERTVTLSNSDWETCISNKSNITDLPHDLCEVLLNDFGRLMPIGTMVNTRTLYAIGDGYTLELDRTELPRDRIDYEIEIELTAPHHSWQGARRVLADAVGQDCVDRMMPSSPKYMRFIQALELVDEGSN